MVALQRQPEATRGSFRLVTGSQSTMIVVRSVGRQLERGEDLLRGGERPAGHGARRPGWWTPQLREGTAE